MNGRPSLTVAAGEAHVWYSHLDLAPAELTQFNQTLSEDELTRSGRFHFARDRERFIAARGILRLILACYTGIEPGQLRFRYGRHGKPDLDVDTGTPPLRFNVSHSGPLAVYGITRGGDIGVDVEQVRHVPEYDALIPQFCSAEEIGQLLSLPSSDRSAAFLACWARKEAYAKARGQGLTMPLSSVQADPGGSGWSIEGDPTQPSEDSRQWWVQELDLPAGYTGALVTSAQVPALCREWTAIGAGDARPGQ